MNHTKLDKDIDFSARHNRSIHQTLNAHSCLWRVDDLIGDIDRVRTAYEKCDEIQSSRNSGFEASSYYAVGYVTCLEWHARSRLRDFLMFFPDQILKIDFEKLSALSLRQMSAANVTVADLVAAATNVSNVSHYINVVERVLSGLNSTGRSPKELLRDAEQSADACLSKKQESEVKGYCTCHKLYEFRHNLVHEIDVGHVGGYTLRTRWSFDEARAYGELVRQLLRGIEAEFTKCAPSNFPNLLDEDFNAVNPNDIVIVEIEKLEQALSQHFEKIGGDTLERWRISRSTYVGFLSSELQLLEDREAVPSFRYFKPRLLLAQRLAAHRLEYLRLLKQEVIPDVPEGRHRAID
jgi:hypothetical protein